MIGDTTTQLSLPHSCSFMHFSTGSPAVQDVYCTCSQQWQELLWRRPTVGLPPDVLPLSGVLFSQSLMRPATPVFITAASCLDKVKGQVKPCRHRQQSQAGSSNKVSSFLSLCLSAHVTHSKRLTSSTTSSFTLNVLPPLPGELNTLPFSHMLLMLRMLSVTTGRSAAPERGDRDSLFSLCGDKAVGLNWWITEDVCSDQSTDTCLFVKTPQAC